LAISLNAAGTASHVVIESRIAARSFSAFGVHAFPAHAGASSIGSTYSTEHADRELERGELAELVEESGTFIINRTPMRDSFGIRCFTSATASRVMLLMSGLARFEGSQSAGHGPRAAADLADPASILFVAHASVFG
jgi:hypothetical protein